MKSQSGSSKGRRSARMLRSSVVLLVGTVVASLALAAPVGATSITALTWATAPVSALAGVPANVVVNAPTSDLITLTTSPSLSPGQWGPTTATAAGSLATFTGFHINVAGTYTITATDTTNNAVTSVDSATVAITATSASQLTFTSEPPVVTTGSFSTTVEIQDAYGNNTRGTDNISLSTATAGCALSGTTTKAATAGDATFSGLTLSGGTNQNCVLTAHDGTDNAVADARSTTVSALGAAAKLAFTTEPPSAATDGVAMSTFRVSVEDANGNVVSSGTGATDAITLSTSPGCTLSGTTATASAGVATYSTSTFVAGYSCTVTASDTTRVLTSAVSTPIAVSTSTPTKLGFTVEPPLTATAGFPLTTFQVATEQGNGLAVSAGADSADVVALTSTCTVLGTAAAVEVAGVATFSNVSLQGAGTCTLVASDVSNPAIAASTSTPIVVSANTPTHVTFKTAPPTTDASLTLPVAPFAVAVEDVYGNVTTTNTGATDVVTITSNCTLAGVTSATAVAGVATFSALIITSPGACVLAASDASRSLATTAANVQVGEPQSPLRVTSLNGYFGTPLTLTTSGGSGSGTVSYVVANGTASGCVLNAGVLTSATQGTCLVTATKAPSGLYGAAVSAATAVTIGKPYLRLTRVVGAIYRGRLVTVTLQGVSLYGRPTVISNATGFVVRVARDTGTSLVMFVNVSLNNVPGAHTLTVIEPNGQRASLRYTLR